jgi:hypothetical protein
MDTALGIVVYVWGRNYAQATRPKLPMQATRPRFRARATVGAALASSLRESALSLGCTSFLATKSMAAAARMLPDGNQKEN